MDFEKEEFEKDTTIFYVEKDHYDHYHITKAVVRWKRDYGFMNITHYYIQKDRKTVIDSEFVFGSVNDAKEYILEKLVGEEFRVQQEIERVVNLKVDGT